MVKFSKTTYEDRLRAKEIKAKMEAGEGPEELEDEIIDAAMAMVETWDYISERTGEPIEPGEPGGLTLDQLNEVLTEYGTEMTRRNAIPAVKKTKLPKSFSGSTSSKTAKRSNPGTFPNG